MDWTPVILAVLWILVMGLLAIEIIENTEGKTP